MSVGTFFSLYFEQSLSFNLDKVFLSGLVSFTIFIKSSK